MKTLPFNACDYRCERCLETEHCAVFRMESEREERNFALGRESDGIEAALRDVSEIFAKTRQMLLEKAEEFGVDLDELAEAEPRETTEDARRDPLHQRAYEFMDKMRDLLKKIEPVITPQGNEFFEDIVWHHTIISAKTFRAISSDYEPEMRFDAVNSAGVAMKSLTICIMALEELASLYPEIAGECLAGSEIATNVKLALRERFAKDP